MHLCDRPSRKMRRSRAMQGREKVAGRKMRAKLNRTIVRGSYDVGRQICYRGKRVLAMSQDFNLMQDKQLAFDVFHYLWKGIKPWNTRWERVNDLEKVGEWIIANIDEDRIINN